MTVEIFVSVVAIMLPIVGSIIGVFVRNETRAARFEQRLRTSEDKHTRGDGVIENLREAIVELKVAIQTLVAIGKRE